MPLNSFFFFYLLKKLGLRAALKRPFWRFLGQVKEFKAAGGAISSLHPVIGEASEPAGGASGHYFHQDLIVAREIYRRKPRRHIDVGSSVYGFVSHVAAFRSIEVLDVRPLGKTPHDSIVFTQADLMHLPSGYEEVCDSVSCLHALEHFGLGRYGDPIDPFGHIKGFVNLSRMLELNGALYLGIPIGDHSSVCFNAHRIFMPSEPLSWTNGELSLQAFHYVDDEGSLHLNARPDRVNKLSYGCGIYIFRKTSAQK
jgi:hypothetical protein